MGKMNKSTPQIAYRLEVPRNDSSQTEIKFTAQPNFIAGIRIGEQYMPLPTPPPKKLLTYLRYLCTPNLLSFFYKCFSQYFY